MQLFEGTDFLNFRQVAEDSNLLIGLYCHWSGVQIEYLDDTASLFHGADKVCSVETLLFHEADSRLQNTLTPLLLGVRNWNVHLAVPWNYSICRKRNMAHRHKFRNWLGWHTTCFPAATKVYSLILITQLCCFKKSAP